MKSKPETAWSEAVHDTGNKTLANCQQLASTTKTGSWTSAIADCP